jgi:hypothetical protein
MGKGEAPKLKENAAFFHIDQLGGFVDFGLQGARSEFSDSID